VLCAMTEKAKTVTPLSSATVAIWRSTKIVTEFLTFQRGSGSVGSALSPQRHQSWVVGVFSFSARSDLRRRVVFYAQTKGVHSSRLAPENGHIFFAPFGSLRSSLRTSSSWNPLTRLKEFRKQGGDW
jgi:hypothetical protein